MELVNIHATALRLGPTGLLIRGPSGAGKSLLALELIAGHGGVLVADDRVDLRLGAHAIRMSCPAPLHGLIELRGLGIVRRPALEGSRLDLVVDLVDTLERMPEPEAFETGLLGLTLPRCPVPRRGIADAAHQILLVKEAAARLGRLDADEFA